MYSIDISNKYSMQHTQKEKWTDFSLLKQFQRKNHNTDLFVAKVQTNLLPAVLQLIRFQTVNNSDVFESLCFITVTKVRSKKKVQEKHEERSSQ